VLSKSLSRGQFLGLSGAFALSSALPRENARANEHSLVRRAIPKSAYGETLPVIGLGTYGAFKARGNAEDMRRKTDVIRTLIEGGGSVIDTAEVYDESEALCGEILESLGARDQAFMSTKIWQTGESNGRASIENAFRDLRTDTIDLMHVHNMVDAETQLPILEEHKARGHFRYIGMSHSTPSVQDDLTRWMETGKLDFVEFNYSVDVRGAEKRLLPMAEDMGIAVLINVPFGSGGLIRAMQGKDVPEWAREELGCTSFAQMLLKFVISHPAVTAAIPRTSKPHHMSDNLLAGVGPMPDARQRERLAAVWNDA